MAYIKIPEDRKPVLIGKDGATKEEIEKKTQTKIFIGEEIKIEGSQEDVDKAEDIIKAIGRGFSPRASLSLLKEGYFLDVISVKGNYNQTKRLMSRVIGSKGKSRKTLEIISGAKIAVYGKTVSIIGDYNQTTTARKGIEMLLNGRTHKYVYKKLGG